jgi:hypothetical protein
MEFYGDIRVCARTPARFDFPISFFACLEHGYEHICAGHEHTHTRNTHKLTQHARTHARSLARTHTRAHTFTFCCLCFHRAPSCKCSLLSPSPLSSSSSLSLSLLISFLRPSSFNHSTRPPSLCLARTCGVRRPCPSSSGPETRPRRPPQSCRAAQRSEGMRMNAANHRRTAESRWSGVSHCGVTPGARGGKSGFLAAHCSSAGSDVLSHD